MWRKHYHIPSLHSPSHANRHHSWWHLILQSSGYSLDGHCKIEMIRWRPRRDRVTNDENCMIRYFTHASIKSWYLLHVLVGLNDQRHVVKRRILSSRFPALPNQSIATGRWVQPNRIFSDEIQSWFADYLSWHVTNNAPGCMPIGDLWQMWR
jgi:hypothetical protein